MMPRQAAALLSLTLLLLPGCEARGETPPARSPSATSAPKDDTEEAISARDISDFHSRYRWTTHIDSPEEAVPLSERFAPPTGFHRVSVPEKSFGTFLRGLPLRTDRQSVRSYRGRRLSSPAAAVVILDVGDRDLQQCADSVLRLHAEWLWSRGDHDDIAYHFTSGDRSAWKDWAGGERFRIAGSEVSRERSGETDHSRENFVDYLEHLFMYAGTRSLRFDSGPVKPDALLPGDFFVAPGSPGHAVLVLDVVENDAGERRLLLGQGFMPAQEFHVLRSSRDEVAQSVWFAAPSAGGTLRTPSWKPFRASQARRLRRR